MMPDCKLDVTGAALIGCTAWLGRIVCGDNTEVLSGFPAECVDLVVTSPPYDDLRTYGGHSWNFETLAAQLVRVLKPGGVIVWVVADKTEDGSESGTSMRQALHFMDVCGLRLHDTMVYAKSNYVPLTHNRYEQAWEYCFVMSKGKPSRWNPLTIPTAFAGAKKSRRGAKGSNGQSVRERAEFTIVSENRLRSNVWEYMVGHQKQVETGTHPAPMPDELAKDVVASWSNPGDVILDPFAGSGTTLKAAKELNRQWCGIEINPEYCAIAEARLSQDVLQLETCAMRPNNFYHETQNRHPD